MKLLIFGATGGTGRCLTEQALARGHDVTVYVRTPTKVTLQSPRLRIEQGNIGDAVRIEQVVPGHDAVLSALGVYSRAPTVELSEGTKNIVAAMEKLGVRRFVCETSLGVGDGRGRTGFFFGRILLPLLLKEAFLDKDRQETVIRQCNLDWVIVRPAGLTNGPAQKRYRASDDASITGGGRISRADVADFMLDQVTNDQWLRRNPELAY